MGWIEFSASVIGTLLSWPLAIVVLAILFRRQIAKKIGDIEEFNVGNLAAGKFIRQGILKAGVKTDEVPYPSGGLGVDSVYDTVGGVAEPQGFPVEQHAEQQRDEGSQQGGEETQDGDEAYTFYSNTALTLMLDRASRLANQRPAESVDMAFDSLATTVISMALSRNPGLSSDTSISAALETLGAPNEAVEAATELARTREEVLKKSDAVQKEDAKTYVEVVRNLADKILQPPFHALG
jgi:hypothetical protein